MDHKIQNGLRTIIFLVLLICFCYAEKVHAQNEIDKQIPNVISFSTTIIDENGNRLPDGNYNIKFTLYDQLSDGKEAWSKSFVKLRIENGELTVVLGENGNSNPITFPMDKKYYLAVEIDGVEVETGGERIELSAAPYSLGTRYAWTLEDDAVTAEKIAPLTITSEKIKSVDWNKIMGDVDPDPYSIYWTILGNIIYGPERNYLGTIERKNFVFKSFSIQRMLFDPYGYVVMGTPQDSVDFEIIGDAIFSGDVYIKGKLGVGVDPARAKVHINSENITPFRVSHDNGNFVVNTDGSVKFLTEVSGSEDEIESYALFVDAVDQGIAIQVDGDADNDNNFVSFWDYSSSSAKGRIEGESYLNWLADPVNIARDVYIIAAGIADGVAIAIQAASGPEPVEAASVISFSAEVAYNLVQITLELVNMGVTYESGSGDYAEWLPKLNPDEKFTPGEIVGVVNGQVTKNTTGADNLSCISFSPIILGNQPKSGTENMFEKVAFLGQVRLKVVGKVNNGDYIIPSGLNDGTGIAISPNMITVDEYSKIVGRAWQSSDSEKLKYINTAVGFNNSQVIELIKAKEISSSKLEGELKDRVEKLREAKNELMELNEQFNTVASELQEYLLKNGSYKDTDALFKNVNEN